MTTRQDHPPRTSQMPTLSQEARKTGRLGCGPNTLKPENSLPLPHLQATWDLLGRGREERARSSQAATLTAIRRQRESVTPPGGAQPDLGLLCPSPHSQVSRGLWCSRARFPVGSCAAVRQATSHLPHKQPPSAPRAPRLGQAEACLLLPSRSLKQPARVLRAGRAGVEHQRKQGRRREQCPAALADHVATIPGAAGPRVA